jgi:hypothetical protein
MSRAFLDAVHANPWAEDFLDLPSLNEGASSAIEESIDHVRAIGRAEPRSLRSTSLVVLGPPGAGKTHLFSRLRRRLGPRAVFVHIRPLVHAEMTPRGVLGEIAQQLGYETQGLPQVNALVGSLLGHLSGQSSAFPRAFLNELEQLSETERDARLDVALEQVLSVWPEVDESYLRRLLRVPFTTGPTRRALLAWLSGRDCDVAQLSRIGATASLGEDMSLSALRTLAVVAAPGAPIALVFDQLENLIEAGGANSRLLAYANLTSELVDTMRGFVLVHMALDTEWQRGIEPSLNASQRSRLLMRQETLALPTAKERESLLRLWAERIPDPIAAFPWPFDEERFLRLRARPGLTPRMLLVECRRALDQEPELEASTDAAPNVPDTDPRGVASDDALQAEWDRRLSSGRGLLEQAAEQRTLADPARLADGVLALGRFLPEVSLSAKGQAPARLVLETKTGTERIAFLAEANPRSLGATLGKLTTLATQTRVIALRERAWDLPPTWKDTLAKRSALLASGKARWVDLDQEDCARLLALDAFLQGARSGEITDERGAPVAESVVIAWIQNRLPVTSWKVASELMSLETPEPTEMSSIQTTSVGATSSAVALPTLRRLRIASVDRLVREILRVEPTATRSAVLAELEAAGAKVTWFGRAILCVREAQ